MDAAKYATAERLHNGALVQIRATHLIAHLIGIARAAELDEFVAVMLALAQGATEGAK